MVTAKLYSKGGHNVDPACEWHNSCNIQVVYMCMRLTVSDV
jgi:hypothetical protein